MAQQWHPRPSSRRPATSPSPRRVREGRRLAAEGSRRALFTASHRDDGINDADRLWCGHGVAIVLPDDLLDNLRGVGIDPITGEDVPVLPPQRLRLLLSPAPMWPLDPFSAKRSVAAFVEDVPNDESSSSDSEIDFCRNSYETYCSARVHQMTRSLASIKTSPLT